MSDVKELNINNTTYDIKAKSVVDTNTGSVKMWSGTKTQYDAITNKDADTLYNVTDDGALNITIDNVSITENSNNELQTVAVIDNRSGSGIKTWTGTKAQYDAITTKDSTTLYNITDDTDTTLTLLELLYPIGSIYIGTMNACPLQSLGVGTWQLVASDRVLQGAGTRGSVGSTVNESLPNITGEFGTLNNTNVQPTGCFDYGTTSTRNQGGSSAIQANGITIDASRSSSTYQDDAPVQQDAYLVNIWERVS